LALPLPLPLPRVADALSLSYAGWLRILPLPLPLPCVAVALPLSYAAGRRRSHGCFGLFLAHAVSFVWLVRPRMNLVGRNAQSSKTRHSGPKQPL